MTNFSASSRDIKAVRKTHFCDQCGKKIEPGDPARYAFGVWEGAAYSVYTHPECSKAAHEYANLNDLWEDEYPWFLHMDDPEFGHHAWLLENHPVVAARLGVKCEVPA